MMLSDNIVISLILGPAAVVPFWLTQKLASLAQNQFLSIGNSTWAGLVELHTRGETQKFQARLLELTGLVSGLSLAVLAPLAAYNKSFITLWVGETNYAGTAVTLLVCLNVWLWGILHLWGWVLQGTGHLTAWTPYALAFLSVNLAASIGGTYVVGLAGPLLGTAAGLLLVKSWAMPRKRPQ